MSEETRPEGSPKDKKHGFARQFLEGLGGPSRAVQVDKSRSVHVGGNVAGSSIIVGGEFRGAVVGHGNTVVNEESCDTQNAELDALLRTLRREFEQAPPEVAEAAAPYVEALTSEAKKEKPNRGFLELTRNGLAEAAKSWAQKFLLKAADAVVECVVKSLGA